MKSLKRLGIAVAASAIVLLSGCETRTQYGNCIGVNDSQNITLRYKVSPTNVVIGVIFVETIFVPVIIILDEFSCPVGKKDITELRTEEKQ